MDILPPKSSLQTWPCPLLSLSASPPQCRMTRGWCCFLRDKRGYFRWNGQKSMDSLGKGGTHIQWETFHECCWCVRHHRLVSSSCVKPFGWLVPVNSVLIPPKDCKGTSGKTVFSFLISCISGNIMSTITLAWLCSIILVCPLIADDVFKLIKTRQCIHKCLIRNFW